MVLVRGSGLGFCEALKLFLFLELDGKRRSGWIQTRFFRSSRA
jgi:hypothetical protein